MRFTDHLLFYSEILLFISTGWFASYRFLFGAIICFAFGLATALILGKLIYKEGQRNGSS